MKTPSIDYKGLTESAHLRPPKPERKLNRFKVVHIQKAVLSTGRAPLRLHNAFVEDNIDSSILSMEFDVNLTDRISELGRKPRIKARLDHFLQEYLTRSIEKKFGLFTFPVLGTDISGKEIVKKADIIYIHWVQGGYLNISGLRKLAELGKPVFIVMHDMWAITGGCHHSFECEKYKTGCYGCPVIKGRSRINWPGLVFRKKMKLYSDFNNLHFIAPSRWLYNCAKQSLLTANKPLHHIPNIIDDRMFKPLGRVFARKTLNIEENEIVIAFGAFSINSAYKGWPELVKALNILSLHYRKEDITILIFGSSHNRKVSETVPFKTRFMGFLKDEYSTVLVYNAADVFVTPSLADNLPTTVLESQGCGTPVVGFDVGGIPDMISHKENGYIAKYRDPEDLAEGIRFCLESRIKGKLLPEFRKSGLLKRHIALIKSVLS